MMHRLKLLSLGSALLCVAAAPSGATEVASQAPTNQSQVAATASESQAQPTQEKKTCKLLPSSGTRFAKKACLSDKEWKQLDAELGQ